MSLGHLAVSRQSQEGHLPDVGARGVIAMSDTLHIHFGMVEGVRAVYIGLSCGGGEGGGGMYVYA